MARIENESVVTQSVLERLIDREPDAKQEPALTRSQSVRLLKASVRRDLEWLLNTRQSPNATGDEFPELTKRGIPPTGTENYGGPAVTAGGLVFIAATKDEKIRAFDAATGKTLWEAPLPAGGHATPAVYAVNGGGSIAPLDINRKPLWTKHHLQFYSHHGLGASPNL